MPGFDGTGPLGWGPMTGRGLGPCGRGMARGRGYRGFYGVRGGRAWRGYSYGAGYYAAPYFTPYGGAGYGYNNTTGLKEYKSYLESELEAVKEELKRNED